MVYVNSKVVRENPVFLDESRRFNNRLNSSSFSDISDNDKKLISFIPYFISLAHPFIYSEKGNTTPLFGMRKDMISAYAAHPLNVCNILSKFGFNNPVTLFQAAFHDNPEEFVSLEEKLKSKNLDTSIRGFKTATQYMEEFLFNEISNFTKHKNVSLPENFYNDVLKGVNMLTPSGKTFDSALADLKSLDPIKDSYFVKCCDTFSVNRDSGMYNDYFNPNSKKYISSDSIRIKTLVDKFGQRLDKINVLRNSGKIHLGNYSKERSLVNELTNCLEYVYDLRDNVASEVPKTIEDLNRITSYVRNNHPSYIDTSHGSNR
jgi:hypothetical protein